MQKLNEQASCLPKTFNVSKLSNGETFEIDAGLMRGIRSGDWLLVGDRGLMIGSIVSDKTIESLFVLKVTDVRDLVRYSDSRYILRLLEKRAMFCPTSGSQ